MSRYRGPRLRIIRRLDLYETLRGFTRKKTFRKTMPGQHCKERPNPNKKNIRTRKKVRRYSIRLQEKQKLRFNYGVTESQLINYVRQAKKLKGSTGELLLQFLEMRLDNVVFRLGMTPTIPAARQLINHGHILVNKKKTNIPSYQCQPNDTLTFSNKKQSRELIQNFVNQRVPKQLLRNNPVPPHLVFNKKNLMGIVKTVVSPRWIGIKLKQILVVEFYSRKV